ncbi:MAG: hypothetical protein NZ473_00395 [Candidatus Kapabacteria bacterium]|nr:hypothetical protein [Candidatus Kapabacteria bacterium]MCS7169713.1 hypothetical protein [Candidatus Kapabacteria bacterium]MDW7996673.1 hypothetical protein [Bacteroidota bacterium]MDW8225529.1 hypothetical protein [Bacteroidota bacterium]
MRTFTAVGCLCVALFNYSCTVPTVPATVPLRLHDTFTVGNALRVHVYECWDSTTFAHLRYIPFFLFRPVGGYAPLYVAAWQEYLGRFAGPLRPAQKELLRSSLRPERLSDSIAVWHVPIYDEEISDLRHSTPVRNRYWSVERYTGAIEEIAALWLRSYPQPEPWEWRYRPSEFWQELQQEANSIYLELRRRVQQDLERYVTHTPLAP